MLQLHTDESNRGRIMPLFGLINRSLHPMGSFPFGLAAIAMGAPWTAAICVFLTVTVVAYVVLWGLRLRDAQPGEEMKMRVLFFRWL